MTIPTFFIYLEKTDSILRMKILIRIFLFVFLLVGIQSCQPNHLERDMAAFDKVFIPLFYYTYQHDALRVQKYIPQVEQEWTRLRNKYQQARTQPDDTWKYSVEIIDQWMEEGLAAINDHDWKEGALKLDHIRYELMQIRECEQIPYYLDRVWDFQMAFEMVQEIANDPMLCLMPWDEFEQLLDDMDHYWKKLKEDKPRTDTFSLDREQKKKLEKLKTEIGNQLEDLKAISDCADREEIAMYCGKMEPLIYQMIRLFGKRGSGANLFA
jgi:hypothetical protein